MDGRGRVDAARVAAAFRPDTILVSVMHANNEVGTVQPVAEIAALAHQRGILVHTDAAQSVGKIPVNVDALGVDLLLLAGHKLYAPKVSGPCTSAATRRSHVSATVPARRAGAGPARRMSPGSWASARPAPSPPGFCPKRPNACAVSGTALYSIVFNERLP